MSLEEQEAELSRLGHALLASQPSPPQGFKLVRGIAMHEDVELALRDTDEALAARWNAVLAVNHRAADAQA